MVLDKIAKLKSKKFVIIIVLIAIFVGAAIFVYNKFVAPKLNPSFVENREFTNKPIESKSSSLYFIYATWCPHSKKVIKHWEELKDRYNNKVVNNYTVQFIDLDGDKQEKEVEEFSKIYNKKIEGYPTIILVKGNEVIEFEAEPSLENLNAFIQSTL